MEDAVAGGVGDIGAVHIEGHVVPVPFGELEIDPLAGLSMDMDGYPPGKIHAHVHPIRTVRPGFDPYRMDLVIETVAFHHLCGEGQFGMVDRGLRPARIIALQVVPMGKRFPGIP